MERIRTRPNWMTASIVLAWWLGGLLVFVVGSKILLYETEGVIAQSHEQATLFSWVASATRDPNLCRSLPQSVEEPPAPCNSNPVQSIWSWSNDGYDVCGKSQTAYSDPQDECLEGYAERTSDPSICFQMNSEGFQTSCYGSLAFQKSDQNLCEELKGAASWENKPICLAVVTKDIHACDVLDQVKNLDYSPKTDCLIALAAETRNPAICSQIDAPGYMDSDKEWSFDTCLQDATCDQSSRRKEICDQMQYPSSESAESVAARKADCLKATWTCRDPRSFY